MAMEKKLAHHTGPWTDAYLRQAAVNCWQDGRDVDDSLNGLLTRVTRLPLRKWFAALGDEVDLKLLRLAIYYARSHDAVEQTTFPIQRWSDRLGLSAIEIEERLLRVLDRMEREELKRYEDNIVRPLSQKLTEYAAPVPLARWGQCDGGYDEVDDRLDDAA